MLRSSVLLKSSIKTLTASFVKRSYSLGKQCIHYTQAEGHYATSPFEPVKAPNLKIHEYVWKNLPAYAKSVAVVSCILSPVTFVVKVFKCLLSDEIFFVFHPVIEILKPVSLR